MAKPPLRCKVLVVDTDSTSLDNVSSMLKHWFYEVVSVNRPVEALATIRNMQDIDLVVTELHMAEMHGLDLLKQITEEFNLPVIVMCCEDQNDDKMDSLESGAEFYMMKPVNPYLLKELWQFVVTSKKEKSVLVSASSVDEQKKNKKASNGKGPRNPPVVWKNNIELHNKFLNAFEHLSSQGKAVPKYIVECMDVPGLTRGQVASHLQRYRNFLRRATKKGTSSSSNFGSLGLGASGNNSVELGFLGNQATTLFSTQSNNMGANSLVSGSLISGSFIMNDNLGGSSIKGLDTWAGNTATCENMETINNNPYSNYDGTGLINDGEFFTASQTIYSDTCLNGSYGLINGTAGLMGSGAFGHLAPVESSSSAGFGNGQANTSVFPPLSSQQQYSLGNNELNDLTFGMMTNTNASVIFGNTAHPEQFDVQFLNQAELLPINQSQNPVFSEPTLAQIGDEDFINSLWSDVTQ